MIYWIQESRIKTAKKLHFDIGTFMHSDIDIYSRESTSVKVIVRIGTFWYTIRGSNYFAILQTIENRRFEASPNSGVLKSVLKLVVIELFETLIV